MVLPFETPQEAEQFAAIVIAQLDRAAPFVFHGTAYEYAVEETGEQGQVLEIWPTSKCEVYTGPRGAQHFVIQRVIVEGTA